MLVEGAPGMYFQYKAWEPGVNAQKRKDRISRLWEQHAL